MIKKIFQIRNQKFSIFIKASLKNKIFTGSLVMVIGMNLYNVGQFVYHSFSAHSLTRLYGKILGQTYYGDLAAIISILGLVGIVQSSLGLTIIKFIASEKDKEKISNLSKWFYWWSSIVGLVIIIISFISIPFLTKFLKLAQPKAVFILVPMIFLFILTNTGRAILQGILKFNEYILSLLTEIFVKIILTVIFVFLGYQFFGVMAAMFIGIVASFIVTQFSIKTLLAGKRKERPNIKPLISYSLPVLVQGLAMTSMYSTDLLLVKHFFSPQEAGLYASLVILGRVAFFGSSPVANVMFPLIARKHSHGEPYHKVFYLSLIFVLGIASFVILFYKFLPNLVITVFFGNSFREGAPILWLFAVFMSFLSLSMLMTQFYLSIGKTKIVILFLGAAIAQGIGIWFLHTNLFTVITISIICSALLSLGLFIYFPYHHRR